MLTITRKKKESVFLFLNDQPIGRVEVSEMTKLKFDAIPELRIVRAELIDKKGLLSDAELPKKKPVESPVEKPSSRHQSLLEQIEKMDGAK